MIDQIVRGPLLAPSGDGGVAYHSEGALAFDARGVLVFAGAWKNLQGRLPADLPPMRISEGVILPPLLDLHTHIPQHPIRGRFTEGVGEDAPGGRLLNALKRNVFPAEIKCNSMDYARGDRSVRGGRAGERDRWRGGVYDGVGRRHGNGAGDFAGDVERRPGDDEPELSGGFADG